MYTIGQVSEMFDLPVSTLRYYDKEGLFPELNRTSGIRQFSENDSKKSFGLFRNLLQYHLWLSCSKASLKANF